MLKRTLALVTVAFALAAPAAWAEEPAAGHGHQELLHPGFTFEGLFGTFDRAAAQRGFQVYKEVCSGCHSMSLMSYRNLGDLGFSEDEVKALAGGYKVQDGPNDQGEMFERPARPSDRFVKPFPNEQAARAGNGGALPPDLSLMVKAREGGADYVYSVLNGYADAPAGVHVPEGMYYNKHFVNGVAIAMPPPLNEGGVTFADGTKSTVPQMASDVSTFLAWAAEPTLERRKRLGVQVILFLIVLTGMLYAVKRRVWADLH